MVDASMINLASESIDCQEYIPFVAVLLRRSGVSLFEVRSIPLFACWRQHVWNATGQARGSAPYTLGSAFVMGQGGAEDPCRFSTCQETFGDLTSKRDTPGQLLTNG
jgi:hypothetical protein